MQLLKWLREAVRR